MEPNEDLMRKIRGLLRQAENTPYEDEAIAFLEKASALMLANAIDQETLWASEPDKRPKPVMSNITIATRMAGSQWQRVMLNGICKANRCRMWYSGEDCTIAGYQDDVNLVELLFVSVKVQMNLSLAKAIAGSGVTGQKIKTFRTNFVEGYGNRMYHRFIEMERTQTTTGQPGMDLVLHRSASVDAFIDSLGLGLRTSKTSTTKNYDSNAQNAGRNAANSADISAGRNKLRERKALPQ